jgi:hypothetical protein
MEKNYLNALEALDIRVLLETVYYDTAFDFVAELIKRVFYVVLEEVEDSQSMPLDNHYTETEAYQEAKNGLNALCSTLLELQTALLQGIGLPCVIKNYSQVDIKPLLVLLPYNKSLEVIDMCLHHADYCIEIKTKCNEDISNYEDLRASLIAIREEV